MKIPGSNDSDINKSLLGQVENKEGLAKLLSKRGAGSGNSSDEGKSAEKTAQDTFKASGLLAALRKEINPESMIQERRSKIDEIKQKILEGKYSVSSDDIAKSISEELSVNILLEGSSGEQL